MIQNKDFDAFKNTLIIYEDDTDWIETPFAKYISSYPFDFLPRHQKLKQRTIQDTLTQDAMRMKQYIKPSDGIYAWQIFRNRSCLNL